MLDQGLTQQQLYHKMFKLGNLPAAFCECSAQCSGNVSGDIVQNAPQKAAQKRMRWQAAHPQHNDNRCAPVTQTTTSASDLQNQSIIFCPNKDGLHILTHAALLSLIHCAQSACAESPQADCQHSKHSSDGSPPGTGEGEGLGGGLGDGVGAGVGPTFISHWNGNAGKPSAL